MNATNAKAGAPAASVPASASPGALAPQTFRFALLPGLLRSTYMEWQEDKAPRLAAAFSFYTLFSLAPLLIIAITIAAAVLGEAAANDQIRAQLQDNVGPAAAKTVQDMITATANAKARGTGLWASLLGIAVSLWGASNLFGQLQDALNTIWEVAPKPSGGIALMVRQRFLSFTMVLGVGFLLLVTLIASTAVAAFGNYVSGWLSIPAFGLQALNLSITFVVTTLFFALVYKVLPDAEVQWRDVWIGALLTTLLFGVGRYLLGLYLGGSSVSSAYGAAGSIVVLLLWISYAAQILFFGAEFTQVFANRFGSKVRPSSHAIPATDAMREQEGLPRLGDMQATEIAQRALSEGRPIVNASEPLPSRAPSGPAGKAAQVLGRLAGGPAHGANGAQTGPGNSKPKPKSPLSRIPKPDIDYLAGAALGFAAILLLLSRRGEK